MSLLGISAAVFSFIVSGLSDRVGQAVMIAFCAIGALAACGAALPRTARDPGRAGVHRWSASGVLIFMATIPSETISVRYVATATGVVVGIGEITGGFFADARRAADAYGLQAPMLIISGTVVMTVLALFLRETAPARTAGR